VGDHATIWAGAVILDHVRIGHHTVVGADAVVTADVKSYETVWGFRQEI
jgi:acetyltransferase-like isoleucine patch superfamily enzyme